jgi:hypothetical protein
VHSQVDFTERTSTKDFAYSIESSQGSWRKSCLVESTLYSFHHRANLLRAGTELGEFTLISQGFLGFKNLTVESSLINIGCYLSDFVFILFSKESSTAHEVVIVF